MICSDLIQSNREKGRIIVFISRKHAEVSRIVKAKKQILRQFKHKFN